MLEAIEAYLALRRATGFAMLNAEYLLKSFAAFATERGQTPCPHANRNRLGGARTVCRATRCPAESRLPLCASCPG